MWLFSLHATIHHRFTSTFVSTGDYSVFILLFIFGLFHFHVAIIHLWLNLPSIYTLSLCVCVCVRGEGGVNTGNVTMEVCRESIIAIEFNAKRHAFAQLITGPHFLNAQCSIFHMSKQISI